MTTDSCGYQKCGVIGLVRQRVAWVVPLLGCVAQLGMPLGAAAMALHAGPV